MIAKIFRRANGIIIVIGPVVGEQSTLLYAQWCPQIPKLVLLYSCNHCTQIRIDSSALR